MAHLWELWTEARTAGVFRHNAWCLGASAQELWRTATWRMRTTISATLQPRFAPAESCWSTWTWHKILGRCKPLWYIWYICVYIRDSIDDTAFQLAFSNSRRTSGGQRWDFPLTKNHPLEGVPPWRAGNHHLTGVAGRYSSQGLFHHHHQKGGAWPSLLRATRA